MTIPYLGGPTGPTIDGQLGTEFTPTLSGGNIGADQLVGGDLGAAQSEAHLSSAAPVLNTSHSMASGIIAYYPMHEGSGTVLTDIGPSGLDGSANVPSWGYDSEIGYYWKNNYAVSAKDQALVDFGNLLLSGGISDTSAFTVSLDILWDRGFSTSTGYAFFGNDSVFKYIRNSGELGFFTFKATDFSNKSTAGTEAFFGKESDYTDNTWNKVTISFDTTGNYTSFVGKDIQYQSDSAASGAAPSTGILQLGMANGEDSSKYEEGLRFKNLILWNRALTDTEVSSLVSDPEQMTRTVEAVITPPPSSLTLTRDISGGIFNLTATWAEVGDATSYTIDRSLNGSSFIELSSGMVGLSYPDLDLASGRYVYRVKAVGAGGDSEYTLAYTNISYADVGAVQTSGTDIGAIQSSGTEAASTSHNFSADITLPLLSISANMTNTTPYVPPSAPASEGGDKDIMLIIDTAIYTEL